MTFCDIFLEQDILWSLLDQDLPWASVSWTGCPMPPHFSPVSSSLGELRVQRNPFSSLACTKENGRAKPETGLLAAGPLCPHIHPVSTPIGVPTLLAALPVCPHILPTPTPALPVGAGQCALLSFCIDSSEVSSPVSSSSLWVAVI